MSPELVRECVIYMLAEFRAVDSRCRLPPTQYVEAVVREIGERAEDELLGKAPPP